MSPRADEVIAQIRKAFARTPYPGDRYLQGSREGCEPEEETGPFAGRHWDNLAAEFLDGHYSALAFFSEGALRFFMPAFLVADLRGELQTADPVMTLARPFEETRVTVRAGSRDHERRTGGAALLNPRRYGAVSFSDYARFRLSVFSREEAGAVVAYLEYRRSIDTGGIDTPSIDLALESFWRERAEHAPTTEELERHVAAEQDYFRDLVSDGERG
ncbi:MAG: DUF6714 family protein [Vicinamibacterales bacterium]